MLENFDGGEELVGCCFELLCGQLSFGISNK